MATTLSNLVAQYGLLAILVLMAGESCGLPIPSEIVVPVGGLLAATGRLNLVAVIVVAAIANLIGSLVAYAIAARWGHAALLGPGRWLGIRRHHVKIADRWFNRHGMASVLVGRVLPVVRTYISFPAGLARVPLGRFVVLTFVGSVPWNAALALAGYTLGAHYERVALIIQRGGYLVAVVVLIAVVAWWLRGRRPEEPDEFAKRPE